MTWGIFLLVILPGALVGFLVVGLLTALWSWNTGNKKKPACWHCDFEADELEEWDD